MALSPHLEPIFDALKAAPPTLPAPSWPNTGDPRRSPSSLTAPTTRPSSSAAIRLGKSAATDKRGKPDD